MSLIKDILNKYRGMPVTVKAALWFVVCTLMQKCISFITIPLFTRLMTMEEYGIYSTYLSWLSILTVICTMNIHTVVYVNQLTNAKSNQERNKLAIPLISLSITATVLIAGVTLLVSDFFSEFIGLSSSIITHIFCKYFFKSR